MRKAFSLVIAAGAVIVTGCESDTKKLARLQTEQTVACLATEANAEKMNALVQRGQGQTKEDSARYLAERRSILDQQIKCDLATRGLNKSTNGR